MTEHHPKRADKSVCMLTIGKITLNGEYLLWQLDTQTPWQY